MRFVYVTKKCNIIGGKPRKAERDREMGGKGWFKDSPILEEGLVVYLVKWSNQFT